jgi:hypothetical protein
MAARLPSLWPVWAMLPTFVLAAKAAGKHVVHYPNMGEAHRAIVRHVVLVWNGRCFERACVLVLFVSTHMR